MRGYAEMVFVITGSDNLIGYSDVTENMEGSVFREEPDGRRVEVVEVICDTDGAGRS